MDVINKYISEDRRKSLKMYDDFKDRMMFTNELNTFHKFGGYVEHILHIVNHSLQLKELWEKNGQ